jgi:hypothetical protein
MSYSWTCSCCGKQFDTLPFDYSFDAPSNWHGLSEAEREARGKLTSDLCVIDDAEFYVRGCVEIPVHDTPHQLVYGVWVSVSRDSFKYILDRWDAVIPEDEPPRFAWLSNWINGYPDPHEIACNLFLRSDNQRPRIVLQPTDYPLAVEQHQGITLDRVKEIAARSHSVGFQ